MRDGTSPDMCVDHWSGDHRRQSPGIGSRRYHWMGEGLMWGPPRDPGQLGGIILVSGVERTDRRLE